MDLTIPGSYRYPEDGFIFTDAIFPKSIPDPAGNNISNYAYRQRYYAQGGCQLVQRFTKTKYFGGSLYR